MVHAAWTGVSDAEVVIHVVDAPAYHRCLNGNGTSQDRLSVEDTKKVSNGLKRIDKKKIFLILNKIDELAHDLTLSLIAEFKKLEIYDEFFLVSAINMEGIKKLSEYLVNLMPISPFLYPADQAADIPSRLMAAEITREKIFLRLHDELPYASTVETESWKNQKNGDVRIDQIIYVRRDSQKPIVLGKGGKTIKSIGASARNDMQDWLGRKVHLFLFVKVRDNWQNDKSHYTETGLEYDA
jgi:GTP-binding protein Era